MNAVAMKVNSANLVKSLKMSFTNKSTFLGEMMQNARRAKASKVVFNFCETTKTLEVIDDGCGIASMEALLTIAESGWDETTIAQEHPFGIGFLSALFACHHIEVVSKSGHINAYTDDILSLKPIGVKPNPDWSGVTIITLAGIDFETEKLKAILENLSAGFPIPVVLNDEALKRPHAHDSGLLFVETEIGAMYLSGVDAPVGTHTEFEVYLQGLPIYSSYRCCAGVYANRHIVHLDSKCFYARLPDRDKLIDEFEVVTTIKMALTKAIKQHFTALKQVIAAEEFVQFYGMINQWKLLDLLNDVPVAEIVNVVVASAVKTYAAFWSRISTALGSFLWSSVLSGLRLTSCTFCQLRVSPLQRCGCLVRAAS